MTMVFKYCSFAKALLFVLTVSTTVPSVAPREIIKIDTDDTGPRVSYGMFGGNFPYTWTRFDNYEDSLEVYDQTGVRYPGGSVTEQVFDVNNPFLRTDLGIEVKDIKNISTFIEKVNKHKWRAIFVLPTIRYVNNAELAELEIERYVRNILTGEYNEIDKGRTVHFEVGNEFYATISPDEYGFIASKIVDAVHLGIKNSNKGSTYYRYEVSVQTGSDVPGTEAVAPYFKDQQDKIDYLTFHWYPGVAEIQFGLWRNRRTKQKFSDRLNDISNAWRTHAHFTKPFFLSEYNINSHTNRGKDYGLRNPLGVMSIFAEAVRGKTQLATIWPVISRDNPPRLFNFHGMAATTLGLFMGWLRDTIAGSRIIRFIDNSSFSTKRNFRQGIYVEAFRKGHDTMIVCVFGMEAPKEYVRLEFSNFRIESRWAERLYTTPGSENDPNVVADSMRMWPKVWGRGKNKVTITINAKSKYEVAKIVLKGQFL